MGRLVKANPAADTNKSQTTVVGTGAHGRLVKTGDVQRTSPAGNAAQQPTIYQKALDAAAKRATSPMFRTQENAVAPKKQSALAQKLGQGALQQQSAKNYQSKEALEQHAQNTKEKAAQDKENRTLKGRIRNTAKGAAKTYAAGLVNIAGVAQDSSGLQKREEANTEITLWDQDIKAQQDVLADPASTESERDTARTVIAELERRKATYQKAYGAGGETERTAKNIYKAADRLNDSGGEDIERAKQGLGTIGKLAVDTGVAGAQMAADATIGALTGFGALVPMAIRSAGGSAQQARREGAAHEQQINYGVLSGALSVATEKIGNAAAPFKKMFGKGFLDDVIEKATQNLTRSAAGKIALSFLEEGGEEVIEDLVQPALQTIYNGKTMGGSYSELEAAEVLNDFLVGGILGGLGGAVEAVQRRGYYDSGTKLPDAEADRQRAFQEGVNRQVQRAQTQQETTPETTPQPAEAQQSAAPEQVIAQPAATPENAPQQVTGKLETAATPAAAAQEGVPQQVSSTESEPAAEAGGAQTPLQNAAETDTMSKGTFSLKEELKNGRAREESRDNFLRRAPDEGYRVLEGDSIAYGYRSDKSVLGDETGAGQIQKELGALGVNCEITDGTVLWNLNGISGTREIREAVTVDGKTVLINKNTDMPAKQVAGHEAFHLWKRSDARNAYIEAVEDNLIYTSPEFQQYQSAISQAYLGGEADLSDTAQFNKLREELLAYISGDIHEGTNDEFLRPMFRDYDAVKAAWESLTGVRKAQAPSNTTTGGIENAGSQTQYEPGGAEPAEAAGGINESITTDAARTLFDGDAKRGERRGNGRESERIPREVRNVGGEDGNALTVQQRLAASGISQFISPREANVPNGASGDNTVTIFDEADWDQELIGAADWAKSKGVKKVTALLGVIKVEKDGKTGRIFGAFNADTGEIFVNAGSVQRSVSETIEHETAHYLAEVARRENVRTFMRDVQSRYSSEEWGKVYDAYFDRYAALTGDYAGMSESDIELYVWEEIMGDAYAEIDQYDEKASRFNREAENALSQNELESGSTLQIDNPPGAAEQGRETAAATERRTGPPERFEYIGGEVDSKTVHDGIQAVAEMEPVAEVSGEEFKKGEKDLITQVTEFFDGLGNEAYNPQLGDVMLTRRGAKSDVAHGIGRKKAAAFAAVPDVLKKGRVIDYQVDWKGRNYDTAVVAAPITIAGEPYMAGVVLTRTDSENRFYVHEVLTEKGTAPFKTGESPARGVDTGGDVPSVFSLLDQVRNVKRNAAETVDSGEENKASAPLRNVGIETAEPVARADGLAEEAPTTALSNKALGDIHEASSEDNVSGGGENVKPEGRFSAGDDAALQRRRDRADAELDRTVDKNDLAAQNDAAEQLNRGRRDIADAELADAEIAGQEWSYEKAEQDGKRGDYASIPAEWKTKLERARTAATNNIKPSGFDSYDAYLDALDKQRAADRAERLRIKGKDEFKGTKALDELGVKIANSAGIYHNTEQLIANDRAAKSIQRATARAEQRLGATKREKVIARDIANGERAMSDIPGSVNKSRVLELADYYTAQKATKTGLLQQQRIEITDALREQAGELIGSEAPEINRKGLAKLFDPSNGLILYHRTPQRIMRALFGWERGQKINEAVFEPVYENEQERKRFINRMFDEVRTFAGADGKKSALNKEESAFAQKLKEGRTVEELVEKSGDTEKIRKAAENLKKGSSMTDEAKEFGLDQQACDLARRYAEWLQTQDDYAAAKNVDRTKVENAIDKYTELYDKLYAAINDFLVAHGYEPIGFIKGYAPHFQAKETNDKLENALKAIGVDLGSGVGKLPTSIAGLTKSFKPNKRYNPFFQHRRGNETDYDIVKGFETYVDYASDVLYHTDDIMRVRQMANYLRSTFAPEEMKADIDQMEAMRYAPADVKEEYLRDKKKITGDTFLSYEDLTNLMEQYTDEKYRSIEDATEFSDLVSWMDDYANKLAGKQLFEDRAMEREVGREALNGAKKLNRMFARANVAGNLSSALNQTAQLPMIATELGQKYTWRAVGDILNGKTTGMSAFRGESDFLTEKSGIDYIQSTKGDKALELLFSPLEKVDTLVSTIAVRGKYRMELDAGKSPKEAMKAADRWARDIMGTRSKGSAPLTFQSKNLIAQMLNMFQVEAANTFEHVTQDRLGPGFKEMAAKIGKDKAIKKLASDSVAYLILAFLLNRLDEDTYGGTPAPFDFLGMGLNAIASGNGLTSGNMLKMITDNVTEKLSGERLFGTDPDDMNDEFDGWSAAEDTLYNISNDVPYVRNVAGLLGLGDETLPMPDVWGTLTGMGKALKKKKNGKFNSSGEFWSEVGRQLMGIAGDTLPGGRQLEKTAQGIEALARGGSYQGTGGSKRLQYPVEPLLEDPFEALRAGLFGKNSLSESRVYWAEGGKALSASQTALYQELVDSGMSRKKAYETIRDFNDATADLEADKDENGNPVSGSKKEKVVEAINKLPLSRKQKNLLYLSRGYSEKDLNSLPWN